ncbi:Lsr2 protein [Streptomyces sp. 2131.1]|uniref:Lsr2 family DNA-binding protein n=1 Tax=Streptomyces sp. 2131.1 TaxID=1855346 RepID=UPI000897ADD9|nr:histone-like nucleoid-structuring protein Lsr2 [Streptomyces sp. 2131.1]SEC22515.1 Lsr2 protein [Streptomyces sp. 2131.1]
MTSDFELSLDELRTVARYATEAARDVLPVFEVARPADARPRAGVSTGDWGGPGRSSRPGRSVARPGDEPIRLWARAHGHLVNDRGRIPAAIRAAYEASQG